MARGKKKEKLTLEEKLERALVPVEEQPYEVPGNWCWTRLNVVSEVVTGSTPSKSKSEYYGNEFPFFKPADLDAGRYTLVASEYLSIEGKSVSRIIPAKSTAVCCIGSIGKSGYLEVEGTTNQQINSVIPKINSLYLYYYINTDMFINELWRKSSATTISIVNKSKMESNLVPMAPLQEQQRIVERIESLFAKLDEAKEKIMEVKESYLARRATILRLAFAGKLTSEWRTQNNIRNNWHKKAFNDVAVIKSNLVQPNEYQNFPHIAPDNIEKRTGVLLQYNTIAEDKVTSGKHRFYPGQILYSKIRPYLSKVIIVDFDGLCSADMYPIEAKENTKYLWYYMLSDDFLEQASSAGSRSVLPKINKKELSKLHVNIPDIDEQEEVVKVLDRLLPYEQKVAEHMEVILEQIDVMKKSILSKAFRGKLGTNNSEEGSAIELLKVVLMETQEG